MKGDAALRVAFRRLVFVGIRDAGSAAHEAPSSEVVTSCVLRPASDDASQQHCRSLYMYS